jgi:feruloyl esterase
MPVFPAQTLPSNLMEVQRLQAAINTAMVAACDKLDGLEDGIISNPDDCSFDPATVPGLNQSEITIVNNLLSDITLSDGTLVCSRFGFGPLDSTLQYYVMGVGNVGYIVYRDPAYDPASWNLNNDYPAVAAVIEGAYVFSADTDDLVSYLKAGKKLIVWHGTDDTALSHYDTIRTMKELARAAGCYGRRNMKLYIVPGVGHCLGGAGTDTFDMVTALVDWVEKGIVPKRLLASKEDVEGNVLFTRPLCEYPRYPHYMYGDPNDAHSFICRRPDHVQ